MATGVIGETRKAKNRKVIIQAVDRGFAEFLQSCLLDMRALAVKPNCRLDMLTYMGHSVTEDEKQELCVMCAAGAYVYRSLGFAWALDKRNANNLRQSWTTSGMGLYGLLKEVAPYDLSPDALSQLMQALDNTFRGRQLNLAMTCFSEAERLVVRKTPSYAEVHKAMDSQARIKIQDKIRDMDLQPEMDEIQKWLDGWQAIINDIKSAEQKARVKAGKETKA